jgi:hypothetical protein
MKKEIGVVEHWSIGVMEKSNNERERTILLKCSSFGTQYSSTPTLQCSSTLSFQYSNTPILQWVSN